MNTPRFFYFDMGNVLLTFSHQLAASQMASLAGIPSERAYAIVFEEGLHWEFERGELSGQQFYNRFCAAAGSRPDCDQLERACNTIFELNVPVVPIVAHLHAAGYRLGVLSNTSEQHWKYVTGKFRFLIDYFDLQALSFRLGAMKPAPQVFARAAELAGVPPHEIFFTDDRSDNIAAALAAGYDAVHFSSARQLARDLRARGVNTNY